MRNKATLKVLCKELYYQFHIRNIVVEAVEDHIHVKVRLSDWKNIGQKKPASYCGVPIDYYVLEG